MPGSSSRSHTSGYAVTIISGLIGGSVGLLVGIPIARVSAQGGLEAIGTGLVIVFSMLCGGTALGAGIGVALTRRPRPIATALLVLPAMLVGTFVALVVFGRLELNVTVFFSALAVVSVTAVWLSRAVAMMSVDSSEAFRED